MLVSFIAAAQVSNKRCKWVKYSPDDVTLDSLSVFPSSVQISYPADSSFKINYDISTGKAKINASYPVDCVINCFNVLTYKQNKIRVRRKNYF
jgi:hypothetical protein